MIAAKAEAEQLRVLQFEAQHDRVSGPLGKVDGRLPLNRVP
jgi:hypothetical protein